MRFFEQRNWDHVLPRSWYPDTTPSNLHKWQIPTCKRCNETYGRLEEDLLVRLALCLDPDASESAGIVARALRSIDPAHARGQKDRRLRQARRTRIFKEMMPGISAPTESIYPNFGSSDELPINEQAAIKVPAESIHRLVEKIVRGIFYLEDRVLIEPPLTINSYALTDNAAKPIVEILDKHGHIYARGPGIVVKRVVAPEDGITSFFSITIFGKFKSYASVSSDG